MGTFDIANTDKPNATPQMGGLGTAAINAGSGLAGTAIGMIGQKQRSKEAWERSKEGMNIQYNNQRELNKQAKELALQQWKDTSYGAQVEEMNKAGINPGLLYGMSGGGGQTASTGSGGSASSGQVPSPMPMDVSAISGLAKNAAEIGLIKAQEEKTKVETEKTGAETQTVERTRELLIENLKQIGIGTLQDNALKAWEQSDPDVRGQYNYNQTYDYHTEFGKNSTKAREIDAAILKTLSETNENLTNIDLTNQKIKGYWTELLNETKKADAAGVQAAAQKLSTEWNTGEFVNWKTWAETADKAVKALTGAIK